MGQRQGRTRSARRNSARNFAAFRRLYFGFHSSLPQRCGPPFGHPLPPEQAFGTVQDFQRSHSRAILPIEIKKPRTPSPQRNRVAEQSANLWRAVRGVNIWFSFFGPFRSLFLFPSQLCPPLCRNWKVSDKVRGQSERHRIRLDKSTKKNFPKGNGMLNFGRVGISKFYCKRTGKPAPLGGFSP